MYDASGGEPFVITHDRINIRRLLRLNQQVKMVGHEYIPVQAKVVSAAVEVKAVEQWNDVRWSCEQRQPVVHDGGDIKDWPSVRR